MDTERINELLAMGRTPKQIAKELGCPRKKVVAYAERVVARRRKTNFNLILTLLLALLVVGGVSRTVHNALREPKNQEVYENILKVSDALASAPGGNSWFIEQEAQLEQKPATEMALIEQLTARLESVLEVNAGVPEVMELKEMFGGNFYPTIFTSFQGGSSRHTIKGTKEEAIRQPQASRLEVVFFGHSSFRHPMVQGRLLFYKPEWSALFIPALRFTDDKWYDAIVVHEMTHAWAHRKGLPTATAPMLSDEWITEELWAHETEEEVLNARTNGVYKQRLRAIVTRLSARSLKRLLMKIGPSDLKQLDQLFGPGLQEERDIRAAQYLLNLCEDWLDLKYKGPELGQRRIEAYRYLIDPRKSTNVQ